MKLRFLINNLLGLSVIFYLSPLYGFDDYFSEGSMRVDYFHTGTAEREYFSIDRIYHESTWGGSRKHLIDTTDRGKYMYRVYDIRTNQLIYSKGFSSIYGEWETTGEASGGPVKTFHESAVFPFPDKTIQFVIAKRNRQGRFEEIFNTVIDPASNRVHREYHGRGYKAKQFIHNGDPARKVDILIVGDGYTKEEIRKFDADVKRFTGELFDISPFKERKKDFNVWTIEIASRESGVDEPTKGFWKTTPLGISYNSLDTPRYVLTLENRALRDIASNAPYDQLYIIFNSERYGGGGIFNFFSTCYSGTENESNSWWADYVFVHEFGHAFAGLGDEYYSSDVAYTDFFIAGVEPWEPNVTALLDPENVKWDRHVDDGTPLPTPWDKVRYDSLGTIRQGLDRDSENYAKEVEKIDAERTGILEGGEWAGKVGSYEGAGYASEGMYRPRLNCIMFTKNLESFCPVCKEAIEEVIDFYTK